MSAKLLKYDLSRFAIVCWTVVPGNFRSWESPQTLTALFNGLFEHVERFQNSKIWSYKGHRHSEYCSKLF